MQRVVIGIDVGTTSISVVAVDGDSGKNIFVSSRRHQADLPPDQAGAFLQDPKKLIRCLEQELANACKICTDPIAIGITGQMHSMLLLDDAGDPVSPVYTWMDNRLSWHDEHSAKTYGALMHDEFKATVPAGYAFGSFYVLQRQAAIPQKARFLTSLPDYIAGHIIEQKSHSISASLAHSFGFFDSDRCIFLAPWEIAKKSKIALPIITSCGHCIGKTSTGIPVFLPEGDNQMSFIASVRDPNHAISVNIGTSGQVSFLAPSTASSDSFKDSPLEIRPFPNNRMLLVGASLSGGKSFELLTHLISETLEKAACPSKDAYGILNELKRPSSDIPLVISTLFNGTRKNPHQTGSISNITLNNFTLSDIFWGMSSGVIEELLAMIGDHIHMLDAPQSYAAISGNAFTKNASLRTTLAERIQRPLRMPLETESAARGAAILALAGLEKNIPILPHLQQQLIQYKEA